MILPAIDVGLMAEHLSTHEGVLHKLEHDYHKVENPVLQQIIAQQFRIMQAHVRVMLSLLDPNQHQWIHLPPLDESVEHSTFHQQHMETHSEDKPIAIETRGMAKSMANDNFTSALMMKNPNVKHVHFEMAIQQATLEREYGEFMKQMGWEQPPMATKQAQLHTIQQFQHLINHD